jgi:hypothetical protein
LTQKYDPVLVQRELGDKKAYIIDNASTHKREVAGLIAACKNIY